MGLVYRRRPFRLSSAVDERLSPSFALSSTAREVSRIYPFLQRASPMYFSLLFYSEYVYLVFFIVTNESTYHLMIVYQGTNISAIFLAFCYLPNLKKNFCQSIDEHVSRRCCNWACKHLCVCNSSLYLFWILPVLVSWHRDEALFLSFSPRPTQISLYSPNTLDLP